MKEANAVNVDKTARDKEEFNNCERIPLPFFYVGGMDNMADFQIVDNMLNKAHI